MSQPIKHDVWEALSKSKPVSDQLTARLADPERSSRLYCAIDAAGGRHLLVLLKPDDGSLRDTQSRGVRAETRELALEGQPTERYVDLSCVEPMGHVIFDALGGELSEGLAEQRLDTIQLVTTSMARWRRFWGQPMRAMLSRDEQIGLFGELWFLVSWLAPIVGVTPALRRWRGPFGSRHDFEWPGFSVEVKATTATGSIVHRINGIDQLSPPDGGALRLFSLVLREEAGADQTLPALIAQIRSALLSDAEAADLLEQALVQAGYAPTFQDDYEKLRLRVVAGALFRVEEDFPRLTRERLVSGLPPGVTGVDYEIDLSGFNHLCVASRPEDAGEF